MVLPGTVQVGSLGLAAAVLLLLSEKRDRMNVFEQGGCRADGVALMWGEMAAFRRVNGHPSFLGGCHCQVVVVCAFSEPCTGLLSCSVEKEFGI